MIYVLDVESSPYRNALIAGDDLMGRWGNDALRLSCILPVVYS